MEVHHHAHSVRQKWTHYFWEFFMLFLAVIAGFLVENQREHYIEHKRAKILAKSLHEDFTADTAALRSIIEFTDSKIMHIDSLAHELSKIPKSKDELALSMHSYWVVRFQPFARSYTTYEQIKNSGMLRYFGTSLVKHLTYYEVLWQEAKQREDGEYHLIVNRLTTLPMKYMNFDIVYTLGFNLPMPEKIYFNITQEEAEYWKNEAIGVKINRARLKLTYLKMIEQAKEILKMLNEEYHLH